jgi:moderate conductance mechanosensitive channel
MLFVIAAVVARSAARVAAFVIDRSDRRRNGDVADTGVITSLRQRETAIGLIRATVSYLAFAIAAVLAIGALIGSRGLGTVIGASFIAVVVGFAAQRFLTDILAGLLMFFEHWFRIGDSVVIEPWKIEGIVEAMSLRSITVRGVSGEVMRVPNSEVKATRVLPRGYREFDIELYASDEDGGRQLLDDIGMIVPTGATRFVRRPHVEEVERLDDDLYVVRARTAVAQGREWLADELLPRLTEERAAEGLIVHGPVVTPVDDHATQRFARALRTPHQSRRTP